MDDLGLEKWYFSCFYLTFNEIQLTYCGGRKGKEQWGSQAVQCSGGLTSFGPVAAGIFCPSLGALSKHGGTFSCLGGVQLVAMCLVVQRNVTSFR